MRLNNKVRHHTEHATVCFCINPRDYGPTMLCSVWGQAVQVQNALAQGFEDCPDYEGLIWDIPGNRLRRTASESSQENQQEIVSLGLV